MSAGGGSRTCPVCGGEVQGQVERCARCGTPLSEPEDALVGRTIGHYVLVRCLARGGQSTIYEAKSASERVAIKILHVAGPRTPESHERLRREALAIRRIQHPNVVRVLDFGETSDWCPWLAMEFLEGESLAALLARVGTLSEAEVVEILAPICGALEEAHKKGVVHRDLKPQNIMLVAQDGGRTPKLLDFGIASLVGQEGLTTSQTVKGTPMYMAPEQWEGLLRADARSDVYSLGAVVYEALSGRAPFTGDTALALMRQVQSEPPLDLAVAMSRRPVSPAFAAAVMKALSKDPDERPQTPLEFLRALRPPPARVSRKLHPINARRRSLWVALTSLLALMLGVAAWRYAAGPRAAARARSTPPLVLLMDTPVAHGVYDPEATARGGTNADTLNDGLADLVIRIQKESIPSNWDREAHVLELEPDLIVIHRSAFFHGLNSEFGYGYPPFADDSEGRRWQLLYRMADDKLITFLGLVATAGERTRFIVYSRGTDPLWPDPDYRREWLARAERRFPAIKNRLSTIAIAGGMKASFKDPIVVRQMRAAISSVLNLGSTRQIP